MKYIEVFDRKIADTKCEVAESISIVFKLGIFYGIINILFYVTLIFNLDAFIDVMLYYVFLFGGIFILSIMVTIYYLSMELKFMKEKRGENESDKRKA